MARSGPLLTLTAGGVFAAVLLAASINAAEDNSGGDGGEAQLVAGEAAPSEPPEDAEAPEDEAPEDAAEEPEEAEEPEPAEGPEVVPYVGWVDGEVASLAILVNEDDATAYVCDGDQVEVWLRGDAVDGELRLTGRDGGKLRGTYDETGATGELSAGGLEVDFAVDFVEPPAGLYAAADTIRGAEVEGNWIVMEDGTQVGLTYVGGEPVPASEIDLRTRKVEIEGKRLPVERVTGRDK